MILGLVRPTSGSAQVLGSRAGTAEATARIGALIEGPGFYPYLSGRDNLRVMTRYRGLPEAAADEALERVDLADRGGDKFKSYSLGMKQRLGVASALMGDPDVIVLDEPTNGLDPGGHAGHAPPDRRPRARRADGAALQPPARRGPGDLRPVGVINNGVLLKESTVVGAARWRVAGGPRRAGRPGHRDRDGRGRATTASTWTASGCWSTWRRTSAPELVRELVAGGVQVHEVGSVERTLEEVFFEMTRNELEQRAEQRREHR